jgi:hypothetical protein
LARAIAKGDTLRHDGVGTGQARGGVRPHQAAGEEGLQGRGSRRNSPDLAQIKCLAISSLAISSTGTWTSEQLWFYNLWMVVERQEDS